ncbi:MAG: butyrate kinase [Syntrophales bacterium]|nr:butyrate kinase [Syntrophales bacterium]
MIRSEKISPGILVVNIGSTSTKLSFYEGSKTIAEKKVNYESVTWQKSLDLASQYEIRWKDFLHFAEAQEFSGRRINIVVSRGGLMRPGPAGVYEINKRMCEDLRMARYGSHASALGPLIALAFAKSRGIKAIVADPPSTDEFAPIARISGLSGIERRSALHALNQKAAGRLAAERMEKPYDAVNLVIAHLGGGITVGAHKNGHVIDSNHGLNEGPFTPERSGTLPVLDLIDLTISEQLDTDRLKAKLTGTGGLVSYLGTASAEKVESMIRGGDRKARLVYRAMAYQISKEIGAMSTVLKGDVDAIVLTGGLAHSKMLVRWIRRDVEFIAPLFIFAGEDEMRSLARSALRVLGGEEKVKKYR